MYTSGNPVFSLTVSDGLGAQVCSGNSGGGCALSLVLLGASVGGRGESTLAFTLTRSGSYSLNLQLSPQDFDGLDATIGSSPYTVQCLPQNAGNPAFLSASPTAATAVAGTIALISITEYDAFGNRRNPSISPWAPNFMLKTTDALYLSDPPLQQAFSNLGSGAWSARFILTRAGNYRLIVQVNKTVSVIPSDFSSFSVVHGDMSAEGTSDGRDPNFVAYTDAMQDDRPILAPALNQFSILAGDRYGNSISSFDQQVDVSVLPSRFEVSLSSWTRSYQCNTNVTGPVNGKFLVSFTSTVAGWFNLSIKFDGSHIQRSPSTLRVYSGVASGILSYPCQHLGTGCYDGVRSDPTISSCSRLISRVESLFCTTVSDSSPAIGYVRIRDRWANDRGESHWEDFIRYNITAVGRAGQPVMLYTDPGCFAGTSTTCSASSPKANAINYDSQGLLLASNQFAGKITFLYPISFVATRSGTYLASLAHGVMLDRIAKSIEGGISADSQFSVFALPDEPSSSTSRAVVLNQTVAGALSNFTVVTFDRFNNSRVVSDNFLINVLIRK
jgi:hypothetical protein